MAKKMTTKRSAGSKSASEKRMGTAAGATIRKFNVAQSAAAGPAAASTILQGDKLLNQANRRLYRQHKIYRMKVSLANPQVSTLPAIQVFALQNTWWTRKAMALAKHIYNEAVEEERAVVGSSRWHDFRINAQIPGASTATPILVDLATGNFVPISLGTTADGEYEYSNVETTDNTGAAVQKSFDAVGRASTPTRFDIFNEYNDMGPDTMNDPVFVATGGYDRATGTSFEAANVADLLNDGNLPPYNAGDLPFNSPWVQVGEITTGLKSSTAFFDAPLGYVLCFGYNSFVTEGEAYGLPANLLQVEFESGGYKGVEAIDIE